MHPYEIRELVPGDDALLDALALESDRFDEPGPSRPARPLGADDAAAFLEDPSSHLWVALVEGEIVGFVLGYVLRRRRGDPMLLFVYEVGTREDWRRRGIATALIEHVRGWAGEAGLRRGFLYAGEHNADAITFYRSLGWQEADERDVLFGFEV